MTQRRRVDVDERGTAVHKLLLLRRWSSSGLRRRLLIEHLLLLLLLHQIKSFLDVYLQENDTIAAGAWQDELWVTIVVDVDVYACDFDGATGM
uniref:Uncharacterized protein n=1 Tax=Romanomermis culicivorax TaxID=13658 RepID=A0A915JDB0_ROMCU